jgi:hypothetical protein
MITLRILFAAVSLIEETFKATSSQALISEVIYTPCRFVIKVEI